MMHTSANKNKTFFFLCLFWKSIASALKNRSVKNAEKNKRRYDLWLAD